MFNSKSKSNSTKRNIPVIFQFFVNKDHSFSALSYLAVISYILCYFVIFPLVSYINNPILKSLLSLIVIIFYIRHIYLFYKLYPAKKDGPKHKRTISDIMFFKNPRPLNRGDFIKIIIALNLLVIAIFFEYFL